MKIKKFTAPSMREALLQIKQELGEEAVILRSRRLPKKLLAIGNQDEIEVTAAIDEEARPQPIPSLHMSDPGVYRRPTRAMPAYPARPQSNAALPETGGTDQTDNSGAVSPLVSRTPGGGETLRYMELKESVNELKDLVSSILQTGNPVPAGGFTGGSAVLYKRLVDSGVNPEIAAALVQKIKSDDGTQTLPSEKQLADVLSREFPVSGPVKLSKDRPLIIAFVGPTGAGKTTTIAKLAAHLSINKQKQVSLIAADTYRIAAIDQIRTFADIIGIGLQVVFSPDEISDALDTCKKDDVVFVDTGGRSQKNAEHMKDLERFLGVLKPDETHLVLSATTKDGDLLDVITRYRPFGVNRLLFTKLDETATLGNILNAVTGCGIAVSYFTTGQGIPDDIELAQPVRFIQRLWEGRTL